MLSMLKYIHLSEVLKKNKKMANICPNTQKNDYFALLLLNFKSVNINTVSSKLPKMT